MLNITGVSVVYPDKTKAVDRLTLHLREGENIALVGANGAGKTTLMLALAGVLQAAEGEISVGGVLQRKETLSDFRSRLGLVFQNPDDMLFMASVYDDIAFGPRNYGLSEKETEKRVSETLRQLNAVHLKNRSPLKLSGGEKRIAAIAAVLVMQPSVILFDEPTAFLDLKSRRTLINLIRALPQSKIIASHDLTFLLETCERTVLMKNGRVFADGLSRELLRDRRAMSDCDLEAIE
jgi:cobalt/nickel transport system ATP-binding protein